MKKFFALVVLLLSSMVCMAEDSRLAGYNNLSDAQKAELAVKVAEMASTKKAPSVPTIGTVERWASFGQQIGSALAGTARELGIVANEFIKTPAGQITMVLIIWKIMGSEIVHIVSGLMILAIFLPLWFYMFRRMCVIKGFDFKVVAGGDGQPSKMHKTPVYYTAEEVGDNQVGMIVVLGIILGVSLVTIFTF